MEIFSVKEFQEQFDELFERVENGEIFGIVDESGKATVIMPADAELIKIHREHDEAP
jgi:PHD/YefM family antitoxin component YafN of YafNO toxin-antitoxin module